MLFLFQELKPRLHKQFLCGNCMWQFLFPCVDGSTNICCSFASVIILHSGDAHGKAKSKMAKVRRRARRAGGANVRDWVVQMTLKKLSHFMWRLVYTDNFFTWQFLFATLKLTRQLFSKCSCHIKIGHFSSSTRANKNCHIKLLYKNCSCRRGLSMV